MISDSDLYHVFKKVDVDGNGIITSTELRLACRYLCKQFQIDIKTVKLPFHNFKYVDFVARSETFVNICSKAMRIMMVH